MAVHFRSRYVRAAWSLAYLLFVSESCLADCRLKQWVNFLCRSKGSSSVRVGGDAVLLNRWLIDEAPPELRRGDLGESGWPAGGKTKTAPLPFACDPPAVPRRTVTATGRNSHGPQVLFRGRPVTSIQSLWTASRCSRKRMSGPATPWTPSPTGPRSKS